MGIVPLWLCAVRLGWRGWRSVPHVYRNPCELVHLASEVGLTEPHSPLRAPPLNHEPGLCQLWPPRVQHACAHALTARAHTFTHARAQMHERTGFNASEVAFQISSGGFSNYFARPRYQHDAVHAFLYRAEKSGKLPPPGRYNHTGRGFPDISAQSANFPIKVKGSDDAAYGKGNLVWVSVVVVTCLRLGEGLTVCLYDSTRASPLHLMSRQSGCGW